MTNRGMQRACAAAVRQSQRESQKRRGELERQAKEMAKLSALEQARLEVETFENSLDVLLSMHKEPCDRWDWVAIAADLKLPMPQREINFELKARNDGLLAGVNNSDAAIEAARQEDTNVHRVLLDEYQSANGKVDSRRDLALRILDGEGLAILEAFAEFNPVAEFSSAGSLRKFAVDGTDLIDCVFKVDFDGSIPTEVKTLTASGKVSVKPMPKTRRHEIYQDYVSACALRMAREVFAMLPIRTVIVTALADTITESVDTPQEQPIVSVVFERMGLERINFDEISPADAIDLFQHRCKFKVTRGSGKFQPVDPFTATDAVPPTPQRPDFDRLLTLVKELQHEIGPAAISSRAATDMESESL